MKTVAMKKLFVIGLLIIQFPIYAQNWNKLEKSGYSISYPSSWEVNESGVMGMSFGLFAQEDFVGDLFRENVNLIEQDLTGTGIDLAKFTEISLSQVTTMIANAEVIENKLVGDHHKLVYSGSQEEFDLIFEQFYWVKNERAYVLTFTAEKSRFEKYKAEAKKMMESFRFE